MAYFIFRKPAQRNFVKRFFECSGRLFILCALLSVGNASADITLPGLDEIEFIYVLGSFDIPDGLEDADGLRDRPRYIIWPSDKKSKVSDPGMDLSVIQRRVLNMLSNSYKTVCEWSWEHENHRAEEYHRGGIVLKNKNVVGWWMDLGGLAYLDFGYNEDSEKIGRWSPLKLAVPESKSKPEKLFLYRVPDNKM